MSLWTNTTAPKYAPNSVPGKKGWYHDITNELLVAMANPPALPTTVAVQAVSLFTNHSMPTLHAYTTGDQLMFKARFNAQVVVTGAPYITVNINGVTRQAAYVKGSGSASLYFAYTLQAADLAGAGQVSLSSPVQLNGGTVKALLDNTKNATLTFSLPNLSALTLSSTVTGITGLSLDKSAYHTADVLALTATFNKAVTITGTPEVTININGTSREATYASGSGSNSVVFHYTVVSGDSATAGEVSLTSPMLLNGGTVKDAGGNNAVLTFAAPNTSTVTFN